MKRSVFYTTMICSVVVGCLLLVSCKDRLDLTNPSYPTVQSYYSTKAQLRSGVTAIYAAVAAPALVARNWFFKHDMRGDEFQAAGPWLETQRARVLNGALIPSDSYMTRFWDGLYLVIHRANSVIANAPEIEADVKKLVGQAKFLRAWAYFELVNFWGGVPIYTKPVHDPTNFKPRAPKEEVFAQIVQDLKDAASVLPPIWGPSDLGRITSGAAYAMLGTVYMQMLEFGKAKAAFEKVIDSPANYQLTDSYLANFRLETEFNKESIWEIPYIEKGDNAFDWGYTRPNAGSAMSTMHNQAYNALSWRNAVPSQKFVNNFEGVNDGAPKRDPRFDYTLYVTGEKYNNGQSTLKASDQRGVDSKLMLNGQKIKISWQKHSIMYTTDPATRPTANPSGLNERMIRLAEIYLDMAECIIEINPSNIAGALKWVNKVRDRPSVNMPHYPTPMYPANNKLDVIKIIMHERMAELGGEQVRDRDIRRWIKGGYYEKFGGDPLAVGGPSGQNPWEAVGKNKYFPIPSVEINNNPALGDGKLPAQNPGY